MRKYSNRCIISMCNTCVSTAAVGTVTSSRFCGYVRDFIVQTWERIDYGELNIRLLTSILHLHDA